MRDKMILWFFGCNAAALVARYIALKLIKNRRERRKQQEEDPFQRKEDNVKSERS